MPKTSRKNDYNLIYAKCLRVSYELRQATSAVKISKCCLRIARWTPDGRILCRQWASIFFSSFSGAILNIDMMMTTM